MWSLWWIKSFKCKQVRAYKSPPLKQHVKFTKFQANILKQSYQLSSASFRPIVCPTRRNISGSWSIADICTIRIDHIFQFELRINWVNECARNHVNFNICKWKYFIASDHVNLLVICMRVCVCVWERERERERERATY